MKNVDVEELPALVAAGKIKKEDAADCIWTDVYFHPSRYGLGKLSDDQKSDFLITMRTRFASLFDDYKNDSVWFRCYIRGCLNNTCRTWLRKEARKSTAEDCIIPYTELEEESLRIAYQNQEQEFKLTQTPDKFNATIPVKGHKRKMAEKTALVLLLKSCCECDDTIITNVSSYTGYDKKELVEKIDRLRSSVACKALKRSTIIRRRDNAFYYHRKYFLELQKINKGTHYFEHLKKRYILQTESWKRQNELLRHRFQLSPSSTVIGKELGIPSRQVCFCISHIRKTQATIFEQKQK